MSNRSPNTDFYFRKSVSELKQLRSITYLKMVQADQKKGWFAVQEQMSLREKIKMIDSVLEAKRLQERLF